MIVTRLRCDACNAEREDTEPSRGWYAIGGPDIDMHHACSLECLMRWADRQRPTNDAAVVRPCAGCEHPAHSDHCPEIAAMTDPSVFCKCAYRVASA